MKIAVVGATGLVGSTMLKVLEERRFPADEIIAVASEKSVGKKIFFNGKFFTVMNLSDGVASKPDLVLFSAGASVSREWAPLFVESAATVIDNSSAWRMDPKVPLIVPEINGDVLTEKDKIISNPNCSTIQMVMVLNPLHQNYKIKRVIVSTYQAVSGTGAKGVRQLMNERSGRSDDMIVYPHQIDLNCIPHIDVFLENGYTKEEMKMMNETRKIMRAPAMGVSATTVRIPVHTGHSESVNVEFEKEFDLKDVTEILSQTPGVVVLDEPSKNSYPMPIYAEGRDEVFVGRIRRDFTMPNTLNCWIVSDNLRKGAATNAVQIAEYLLSRNFIQTKKMQAIH